MGTCMTANWSLSVFITETRLTTSLRINLSWGKFNLMWLDLQQPQRCLLHRNAEIVRWFSQETWYLCSWSVFSLTLPPSAISFPFLCFCMFSSPVSLKPFSNTHTSLPPAVGSGRRSANKIIKAHWEVCDVSWAPADLSDCQAEGAKGWWICSYGDARCQILEIYVLIQMPTDDQSPEFTNGWITNLSLFFMLLDMMHLAQGRKLSPTIAEA